MRWAGHVACLGRGEEMSGFCWGNTKEKNCSEDVNSDGIQFNVS